MEGLITVRTRADVGGETEQMELQTTVVFRQEDDRWILNYTETPPEGEETAVTVTAREQRVQVERTGDMRAKLLFWPGAVRECHYETPFGRLFWKIHTHRTEVRMSSGGGCIRLWYDLEDAAGHRSRHEVDMAVKTTAGKGCD